MTYVEIGVSLARKAALLNESGDAASEKTSIISRIFSNMVAECILAQVPRILWGSGLFDSQTITDCLDTAGYNDLLASHGNIIKEMDLLANIIFER